MQHLLCVCVCVLIQRVLSHPSTVYPHSKTVLMQAISKDTQSLASLYIQHLLCLCVCVNTASIESPLYVYPHSKTVLMQAISKDTEFLASHLVMDYSLLVGVDDVSKELVVGIIGTV